MKHRAAALAAAAILALCLYAANLSDSAFSLETRHQDLYTGYGKDGHTFETYQFDLQPGRYTFTLESESDGGVFELYSPRYASPDNTAGAVFASVPVPAGRSGVSFDYTADGVIRGARLRFSGGGAVYIHGIAGESAGSVYSDPVAVAVFALVFGAAVIWYVSKQARRDGGMDRLLPFFACAFAALCATMPLLRFSLPYAHDINFHLVRIEGVYESLRGGQFPARMGTTFLNGYGYADQIMYPPLFLYFPAVLRLLRVSPMAAYQLFMFAINLATAGISYFAFRRLMKGRETAAVAAFAYTLCAFRLICVFTRAAVGELLAMAFLPLILLGMYEVLMSDEKERGADGRFRASKIIGNKYLVLGFTGVMNSHIVSVNVAVVLCVIFTIACIPRWTAARIFALVKAAAAFLVLNLWTIYPLLSLSPGLNVMSSLYNSADDAVYPFEMFSTYNRALGLSGGLHEPYTAMPLTVGAVLGGGALLFLFTTLFLRRGKNPDEHDKLGRRMCVLAIIALFFASTLFPWAQIAAIPAVGKFFTAVQFPWRYFGAASLALCVTFALGLFRALPPSLDKRMSLFICCAIAALFAAPYLDMYMQDTRQTAILRDRHAQFGTDYIGGREYLRAGTDYNALISRPPIVTAGGADVSVSGYTRRYDEIEFHADAPDAAYVEVPVYYYPGYRAVVDGRDAPAEAGENGVLRVYHGGAGHVRVFYRAPAAYRVCELISLAAAVALSVFYARGLFLKNKGNKSHADGEYTA